MSTKKPAAPKSALAGTDTLDRGNTNAKLDSLEPFRSDATEQALRTNQGVKVSDNQNTLKVGAAGRTFTKSRSTARSHSSTTASAMPCTAPPSTWNWPSVWPQTLASPPRKKGLSWCRKPLWTAHRP